MNLKQNKKYVTKRISQKYKHTHAQQFHIPTISKRLDRRRHWYLSRVYCYFEYNSERCATKNSSVSRVRVRFLKNPFENLLSLATWVKRPERSLARNCELRATLNEIETHAIATRSTHSPSFFLSISAETRDSTGDAVRLRSARLSILLVPLHS